MKKILASSPADYGALAAQEIHLCALAYRGFLGLLGLDGDRLRRALAETCGIWNPAHIRACSGARSREGAGSRSDSSKLTRHVEGGAAGRFRVARRVPGAGCGNGGGAAERRREEVGAAPPTYAVGGRR